MSLTSTFHNIEALTASSKAFDQQRLVAIHYKSRNIKNPDGTTTPVAKFPSLCVSVPALRMNLSGMPAAAQSVTLSLWENLQDDLIRSLIDQRRQKDAAGLPTATSIKTTVSDDEIALESIAAFAAATGNGKLSSEGIGQWFDSNLTEPLVEALLATDAERTDDQVKAILHGYRDAICKLAAVVPNLTQANIQQVRKAVLKAPEEDSMAPRLLLKLDAMDKSRNAAVLADLL